jgi:hypothetical protein
VDRHADARHAGCVGHRKVGARLQRSFVLGFDLAAEVQQKRPVRDVDDLDSGQFPNVVDDILAVLDRSGVDSDVADDVSAGGLDDVNRADVAAGAANSRDDFADHPHFIVNPHSHRDAIRRARRPSHFFANFLLVRAVLILHIDRLLLLQIQCAMRQGRHGGQRTLPYTQSESDLISDVKEAGAIGAGNKRPHSGALEPLPCDGHLAGAAAPVPDRRKRSVGAPAFEPHAQPL